MVGQRFGRLLVISPAGSNREWHKVWKARCDCGKTRNVTSSALKTGRTRSCGCLRNEISARKLRARATHGLTHTYVGRAYWNLRYRAANLGIPFLFESLSQFAAALGPRPSAEHVVTIAANLEPVRTGNVVWATRREIFFR
jgi:hypothetical protein